MRVGIDLGPLAFGSLDRGIGIYAENLITELARISTGTEYRVLLLEGGRQIPWLAQLPANFKPINLPAPRVGRARALLSHQLVLPVWCRRLGLDLLHCIDVPFNPSHPGLPLWSPVPIVVTVCDLTPLHTRKQMKLGNARWAYYQLMLGACRRAAHLVTISDFTARELLGERIANPSRLSIIPLAAPRFEMHGGEPSANVKELATSPFLLHVGGADPRKNQEGVLEAFRLLCEAPGFAHKLILVGSHHLGNGTGETPPQLAGRIHRFSHLSRADMWYLYRHCDVFVFPSWREGFGLPILEAMSFGAPVVASRIPAIAEVAQDAAILVDPADSGALARAVSGLIVDPDLSASYAEKGRIRVQSFDWGTTARKTHAIYVQVSDRGARHAS